MLPDFEQLCNVFIRPQRHRYKMSDLGSKNFQISGQRVHRQDFQLKNSSGMMLECSLYSISGGSKESQKTIVYLHCNSGCRLEGLTYLKEAIAAGFSLVLFDFAGSGNSQGDYVSLGFHESDDVRIVIEHLRGLNSCMTICLWGRSMGAVAALQYVKKNNDISLAVYDSPFSSLRELAVEIGKQKTRFPKFFIELFLDYLKPIIAEKARFNIDQLEVFKDISTIKVPGIFIGSTKDKLVPFQQVQKLFQSYTAKKQLFLIDQGHNEPRNKEDIEKVFKSVKKYTNNVQQQTTYMQTQFDQTTKSKKKLNLTLKCFSQKQLCVFKSKDKPQEKIKKITEVRQLKNNASTNKSAGCQSLKETKASQDLTKSIVKEKQAIRLSIKNTTKCSEIKKPTRQIWKLRVRQSLDDITRIGSVCQQVPQISKGYHGLEKRTGLKKFKSQSIKQEIMKNNLSSDNISYRRVVDTQKIVLNENHSSQKDLMMKARNTIHHLQLTDNDSYNFKRISFTKGNKKNKEN